MPNRVRIGRVSFVCIPCVGALPGRGGGARVLYHRASPAGASHIPPIQQSMNRADLMEPKAGAWCRPPPGRVSHTGTAHR